MYYDHSLLRACDHSATRGLCSSDWWAPHPSKTIQTAGGQTASDISLLFLFTYNSLSLGSL